MMKRVLSIQDLSCVGRCSLTVALPVLSAMGVQCSVLPTAVLSTHTAFPKPEVVSLTGSMVAFGKHWEELGICFDAVSVGYLSDPEQAEAVLELLNRFGNYVVLDPVMGDNGKLYSRITAAHVEAMKKLCAKADVVLPNVTEAAYLTGLPMDTPVETLAQGLLGLGAKAAIITGVRRDGEIGFYCSESSAYYNVYVPRHFHGTGDLFAATFLGGIMGGKSIPEAGKLAADFVRRCVLETEAVTPFGVEFEKQLPWLIGNMR